MTELFATVRADEQNLPLFVHVLGATILVGGLFAGGSSLALARGEGRWLRLGYWALLVIALPGWILMRIGAQWIYSEQGWDDLPESFEEPTWLGIGWLTADLGGIVLLLALVVGGVGVVRLRAGKGAGLLRVTLVLALVLLAAYLVTAWAMAGKPS
ncbi:MAG TPA: hypothetical protein VHH55_01480 [Gaiellaceae bacterium]|nr:hypothetical protein [Gaiellaceae bacterium]